MLEVHVINLNGMPTVYKDVTKVRYLWGNRLRFTQRREKDTVVIVTSLPYLVKEVFEPDIFVRPAGM